MRKDRMKQEKRVDNLYQAQVRRRTSIRLKFKEKHGSRE